MVDKVSRSFADGRNMRGRWQTSPTTGDSLLDAYQGTGTCEYMPTKEY